MAGISTKFPDGPVGDAATSALSWSTVKKQIARNRTALALPTILLLVAVIGGANTPGFFGAENLEAILRNAALVGIGAVGMALVTVSGNFISLSVQQQAMLAAMLLAATLSDGWSLGAALPVIVLALLLISIVQGGFVALGLNPVIATLAVGSIIYGGVQAVAGGKNISFDTGSVSWLTNGKVIGLPSSVFLFLGVAVIGGIFIRNTVLGRQMRLSGENREAAELSGISAGKVAIYAFVGLGLALTLCGILGASEVGTAQGTMLETLTIDVATAVLVGGVAIAGGEGSPVRAAIGAVFISLLNNLMVLHSFSAGARQLISGLVLLMAVILVHVLRGSGAAS